MCNQTFCTKQCEMTANLSCNTAECRSWVTADRDWFHNSHGNETAEWWGTWRNYSPHALPAHRQFRSRNPHAACSCGSKRNGWIVEVHQELTAVFNPYSVHGPANPFTSVRQEVWRLTWLKINTERPTLPEKVAFHGQTVHRNMLLSLLLFSFSTQDVSLGLGEVPRQW